MRLLLTSLLLVAALLALPAGERPALLYAQDGTRYWCSIGDAGLRACPRWHECGILLTYSPNTLLIVRGMATGDREAGSDQWLVVEDPVQLLEGYIHTTHARPCEPADWQTRPVIPQASAAMREVYTRGLAAGNNPHAFSKVGDCQNVEAFFLSHFDTAAEYELGPFADLQATVDNFSGSFVRDSAAVEAGYTVASALSPLWADPVLCESGETPLACEDRLNNPSIVLISMETWNRTGRQPVSEYEDYLGQVVEFWIERGVVPILGTKADNLEGDGSINAAIVRVADRYQVPLWNFWLAAQSLPGHGFDPAWNDGFHLLWARSFYNNPARLRDGWPVRNLTALQALTAVWRGVHAEAQP